MWFGEWPFLVIECTTIAIVVVVVTMCVVAAVVSAVMTMSVVVTVSKKFVTVVVIVRVPVVVMHGTNGVIEWYGKT